MPDRPDYALVAEHRAGETLDYGVTFANVFVAGETIASYAWTQISGGSTITKDSEDDADPIVKVWLSGGVRGFDYVFEVEVVTDSGRTYRERILVQCR